MLYELVQKSSLILTNPEIHIAEINFETLHLHLLLNRRRNLFSTVAINELIAEKSSFLCGKQDPSSLWKTYLRSIQLYLGCHVFIGARDAGKGNSRPTLRTSWRGIQGWSSCHNGWKWSGWRSSSLGGCFQICERPEKVYFKVFAAFIYPNKLCSTSIFFYQMPVKLHCCIPIDMGMSLGNYRGLHHPERAVGRFFTNV